MEIKTTREIWNTNDVSKKYQNKKWVAVDDVIKIFEDDSILSFEDLKDIIEELRGKE